MSRVSCSTPRGGGDPSTSGWCQQCSQADQVVGRRGEGHDPIDELAAAVPQLAQPADGLHPAEDLLDQFPFPLADRIARVPGGAAVDRDCRRPSARRAA